MAVTAEMEATPSLVSRLAWVAADSWTIARRHLAHIRSTPERLSNVTIQPIMFVFMFAYIFGSAIVIPGGNYRQFLMPGIFTQSMAFASMTIMTGIVDDMAKGVMDRLRSLPMARAAILIGHTGANLIENLLGLAVMAACGLLVGWRPENGLGPTLSAGALLLLFGFAMNWIGVFIGQFMRSVEGAQSLGFVVIMPFTFVANTFVPTQGMPPWLRVIANWNPTSTIVAACRQLFGGLPTAPAQAAGAWPLAHPVIASLIWCVGLIAVFLPLAVWRFRWAMSR
jgi:ABC-2 type transport system permease protein